MPTRFLACLALLLLAGRLRDVAAQGFID